MRPFRRSGCRRGGLAVCSGLDLLGGGLRGGKDGGVGADLDHFDLRLGAQAFIGSGPRPFGNPLAAWRVSTLLLAILVATTPPPLGGVPARPVAFWPIARSPRRVRSRLARSVVYRTPRRNGRPRCGRFWSQGVRGARGERIWTGGAQRTVRWSGDGHRSLPTARREERVLPPLVRARGTSLMMASAAARAKPSRTAW